MSEKNRNLFRITRFILLKLPAVFRFFSRFRKSIPHLLIIKTDAIGDYILFRNFLEIVRGSKKFRDHRITLLGNMLWEDIARKYDSDMVDQFIFIKPGPMLWQPAKALKLAWQLYQSNFSTVLQPAFTRLLLNDGLAGLTAGKEVIGFESDNEGITPKYKAKTDRFYAKKLALPDGVNFEFDRSKFFFETVLEQKINIPGSSIPTSITERNGIVIFPGAGILKRCWEPEKFAELIKLILNNSNHQLTLAGGPGDTQLCDWLMEQFDTDRIVNLAGRTSLPELIELIGKSALVIANETSAIHIAAATQTPSFCILGGGHFGRFAPYPQEIKHAPICVYKKIDCFNCNWECIYKTAQNESFPCISGVDIQAVWASAKQYL